METFHTEGSPLAAYLEGEGKFDPDTLEETRVTPDDELPPLSFAPPAKPLRRPRPKSILFPLDCSVTPPSSIDRLHNAWSTALNSRIGRADNEKFLEHFRYILVASQLLNEFIDHGSAVVGGPFLPSLDGVQEQLGLATAVATSPYGAAATATIAFALVYIVQWARSGHGSVGRLAVVLTVFALTIILAYGYVRRQWLQYVRQHALSSASSMTSSWQSFEKASSSALSFVQEVELVSKGYRLSTPLPPASRVEDNGPNRRCGRLRRALHKSYSAVIPACIDAFNKFSDMIDNDDLERYYEVYDISLQDARESTGSEALGVLDGDAESLRSLRVLSYRAGVLRRITLCALLSLKADGGKPDFARWTAATDTMEALNDVLKENSQRLCTALNEMESLEIPVTPVTKSPHAHGAVREKMRSQVRKISALSSGIKGLQAKMQVLREETNRSIEKSEDLTDLGPHLMAQYDSIGADLKELMQAWETGKASLASNITKQERRISLASSGLRSPVSSLGGLTAVDEDNGSPAAALRALTGGGSSSSDVLAKSKSNRSSTGTTTSEDEVFEAVALPRQRSTLTPMTREERIAKMYEERERQAALRATRDANTSMLKELETVINLRPKKPGPGRITSF